MLQHKTEVDDVPLALAEFHGRILVGCGRTLRIYDLGKRKLLRKAENRGFPTMITQIKTMGDRVYVRGPYGVGLFREVLYPLLPVSSPFVSFSSHGLNLRVGPQVPSPGECACHFRG